MRTVGRRRPCASEWSTCTSECCDIKPIVPCSSQEVPASLPGTPHHCYYPSRSCCGRSCRTSAPWPCSVWGFHGLSSPLDGLLFLEGVTAADSAQGDALSVSAIMFFHSCSAMFFLTSVPREWQPSPSHCLDHRHFFNCEVPAWPSTHEVVLVPQAVDDDRCQSCHFLDIAPAW